MKKVILVKISYSIGMNYAPMGLLYVGGALKRSGFEVEIIHSDVAGVGGLAKNIVDKDPMYVGFSVITADPMRTIAGICGQIKELNRDLPVVWGGIHPSLLPEQCLGESYIDIVTIGEGEETSIDLTKCLEEKRDLKAIPGIGFKDKDNKMIINPGRPLIKTIDNYPMDWDLIDVEKYIYPYEGMKRVLDFVTSRGCPHQCGFCYNVVFNKRRWRAHSIEKTIAQISMLKNKHNLDGIIIQDDNFFVNRKRAFAILEGIELKYHAEARVDYITEDFARKLEQTGCRILLLGIESGSNRILKLINKEFDVDRTNNAIDILARYPQMRIACSAIFGYPTETRAEYRETLMMTLNHMERHPWVTCTTGFYLPYPGTDLYDMVKKEGFTPPRRTEDWEDLDRWGGRSFRISWVDWLSTEEVKRVRTLIYLFGRLSHRGSFLLFRKLIAIRLYLSTFYLYRAVFPVEAMLIKYRHCLKRLFHLLGLSRLWTGLKGE